MQEQNTLQKAGTLAGKIVLKPDGLTGGKGVLVQGDHFQISAKKYAADAAKETQTVKNLIWEAIDAGFFNIDIDTSTLVDLSRPTIKEQQKLNYYWKLPIVFAMRLNQIHDISLY